MVINKHKRERNRENKKIRLNELLKKWKFDFSWPDDEADESLSEVDF